MSYLRDGDTAASLTREALHISDEQVRREQAIKEDDLVQRLRERGQGQEMFGFDGMLDDGDPLLIEAADEIERLRAQLAERDRDAERYLHMRNTDDWNWDTLVPGPGRDAAIDAAMAQRASRARR